MNTLATPPTLHNRVEPAAPFGWRATAFISLFLVETIALAATSHGWSYYPHTTLVAIVFFAAFFSFSRQRLPELRACSHPVRPLWLAAHIATLLVAIATTIFLLGYRAGIPLLVQISVAMWTVVTTHTSLVFPQLVRIGVDAWYLTVPLLLVSLVGAFFSVPGVARWFMSIRRPWFYAGLTAVGAVLIRHFAQVQWESPASRFGGMLQTITFSGAKALLQIPYSGVKSNLTEFTLGTPKFTIAIGGACSGVEGLALMLMLSVGWLIFARRELNLKRAIWLVPISLGVIWTLNLVRIDTLIAIGDAGYGDVAVNGFHSQAGWILFNITSLAFLLIANNLRWLHKDAGAGVGLDAVATMPREETRNPAAIYLLPFLAILATTFITQAASSGFELLYPLRLVAAVSVLWAYREEYRKIDWRFTWLGPVAGVAIFVMWLAIAHYKFSPSDGAVLAKGIAKLPAAQRTVWLVARVLAAVVTVPIAEELAFRGYLARRIASADIESISYQQLGFVPIVVSSLIFGIMHGKLWVAGAIAGLIFVLVARWRGRLGEAVVAHSVANLMIAVWVLMRGDYALW